MEIDTYRSQCKIIIITSETLLDRIKLLWECQFEISTTGEGGVVVRLLCGRVFNRGEGHQGLKMAGCRERCQPASQRASSEQYQ